jgi:hypothetical protein
MQFSGGATPGGQGDDYLPFSTTTVEAYSAHSRLLRSMGSGGLRPARPRISPLGLPPVYEMNTGRGLAGRAKENVVSAHTLPADRPPATRARIPFSIANLHMISDFDVDGLSGSLHLPNPPGDHRLYRSLQPIQFIAGQSSDECLRVNPGFEENLVGVGVADGAERSVIIDERTHLPPGRTRGTGCRSPASHTSGCQ